MAAIRNIVKERANWRAWLDLISEQPDRLTKWEENFIASLSELRQTWGEDRFILTERQAEILARIYAAKTN
jgi:hypothetical protein